MDETVAGIPDLQLIRKLRSSFPTNKIGLNKKINQVGTQISEKVQCVLFIDDGEFGFETSWPYVWSWKSDIK